MHNYKTKRGHLKKTLFSNYCTKHKRKEVCINHPYGKIPKFERNSTEHKNKSTEGRRSPNSAVLAHGGLQKNKYILHSETPPCGPTCQMRVAYYFSVWSVLCPPSHDESFPP